MNLPKIRLAGCARCGTVGALLYCYNPQGVSGAIVQLVKLAIDFLPEGQPQHDQSGTTFYDRYFYVQGNALMLCFRKVESITLGAGHRRNQFVEVEVSGYHNQLGMGGGLWFADAGRRTESFQFCISNPLSNLGGITAQENSIQIGSAVEFKAG